PSVPSLHTQPRHVTPTLRIPSPLLSISSSPSRAYHPPLNPFPTRRSSDLDALPATALAVSSLNEAAAAGGHGPDERALWRTVTEIGRATSELQSRFDIVCRLLLEEKISDADLCV